MTRRIPPLNPLHVFEVAARVNGFSRAATELNVTQSAVSRQIAVLESYLGVRLFHRERHGASLTEAGAAYAAEIREPFVRIAVATARLLDQKATETLHVRAYATFAAKWLIPRLADFHARYPRVRIQLSNTVRPIDFSRETIDVGIQLGQGDWPGTQSRLLLQDLIQPVCSPDLARTIGDDLSALRSQPLLHSHYRRRDWGDWLAARGLPEEWGPAGMTFESSVLTYQAAAEGLGIAMGQVALLREDIAAGRLVPLFGPPLARDLGHHAVWPVGRPMNRKLEIFLSWLQAQTGDPDTAMKRPPVRA